MIFAPYPDVAITSEHHEPHLRSFFESQSGDTFVDVGAHIGKYTIPLASRFEHVYAIEALRPNAEALFENLKLNNIDNVTVCRWAAWNKTERIRIGDAHAQGSIYREGDTYVLGTRLDNILKGKQVDLVKIDVEGAEVEVLEGLSDTLKRCHPTLVIEVHDHLFPQANITHRLHPLLVDYDVEHNPWLRGDALHWICRPRS